MMEPQATAAAYDEELAWCMTVGRIVYARLTLVFREQEMHIRNVPSN